MNPDTIPRMLFEALRVWGRGKTVRVEFYGRYVGIVKELACNTLLNISCRLKAQISCRRLAADAAGGGRASVVFVDGPRYAESISREIV